MPVRYDIRHATTYDYSEAVTVSHHLARLTPRRLQYQNVQAHAVRVDPSPAVSAAHRDYFGNDVTFFAVQGPHDALTVVAESVVIVTARSLPEATPPWEEVRDECLNGSPDCFEFVLDSTLVQSSDDVQEFAAPSFPPGRPLADAVMELVGRIHADMTFDPEATTVATPLAAVLQTRRGVCQDFAHLTIACLRSLGLAARYVSGYLETTPPADGRRLLGADASHAWVSVYCPGSGWLDLDPTNNLVAADRHVTLAWGRDYDDVSPIRGVILGGGEHRGRVAVDVVRREADDDARPIS